MDIWSSMLNSAEGSPHFRDLLVEGDDGNKGSRWWAWEICKFVLGYSDYTLPASMLALVERVPELFPAARARFVKQGNALRELMNFVLTHAHCFDDGERIELDRFEEYKARHASPSGESKTQQQQQQQQDAAAVLLLPTHPNLGARHNFAKGRPLDFVYTGLFNVLELPATHVPLGMSKRTAQAPLGAPLGCQIVGAHGKDRLNIRLAEHLERAFGGFRAPLLPARDDTTIVKKAE
jgi:fatty acid amide hydrolase 2